MTIIVSNDDLKKALSDLQSQNPDFITIDTEFIRDRTYFPKLCLIQIAAKEFDAIAIDPLAEGLELDSLFDILQNPKITKVFHSARQDIEIFYNLSGKIPTPVFDTQIAAMVCGYGNSVSYDNLVKDIDGTTICKLSRLTNWDKRPLTKEQIDYALSDVIHLIPVYEALLQRLEDKGRSHWINEEMQNLTDTASYDVDWDNLWRRIKIKNPSPKNLVVLQELAIWREKEAQNRNIPKAHLIKDHILAELASHAPTSKKALSNIRGTDGLYRHKKQVDMLLEVIQEAKATPKELWPSVKPFKPEHKETGLSHLLKMLLKIKAIENDVAESLIASSNDILKLAHTDQDGIPCQHGWRFNVFGKDAERLKKGEIALTVSGTELKVVEL